MTLLVPVPVSHRGTAHPEPIVGILGGMGPAASAQFYTRLVELTPALEDQSHLPVILWSDPATPDRSAAILGSGADPTRWLQRGLDHLQDAGATLIAVPCNSAHYFLESLRPMQSVPVLDMIEATCRWVSLQQTQMKTVGLLATTGLVSSGVYQERLERRGIRCLVPTDADQEGVASAITAVKTGVNAASAAKYLEGLGVELVKRGCEAIIAGCTEIPLVLRAVSSTPIVDPGLILANLTVSVALEQRRVREDELQ